MATENNMIDYELIKNLAREKKISLAELAEKIGYSEAGFHKAVANDTLKIDALIKLSELFSISFDSFIKSEDVLRMANALSKNKIDPPAENENYSKNMVELQERMLKDVVNFFKDQLIEKDKQIAGKDRQLEHLMKQLELKDGLIRSIIDFTKGMGVELKNETKVENNSNG